MARSALAYQREPVVAVIPTIRLSLEAMEAAGVVFQHGDPIVLTIRCAAKFLDDREALLEPSKVVIDTGSKMVPVELAPAGDLLMGTFGVDVETSLRRFVRADLRVSGQVVLAGGGGPQILPRGYSCVVS